MDKPGFINHNQTFVLFIDYGDSKEVAQFPCRDYNGSVFDALNSSFKLGYKMYPGLGAFVECINNICQNSTHAWFFYVDGKLASVGVSSYSPKCGQNITMIFKGMSDYLKMYK